MEDPDNDKLKHSTLAQPEDSGKTEDGVEDCNSRVKLIEDSFEILSFWYNKNLSNLKSQLASLRETCDNLNKECANKDRIIASFRQNSDNEDRSKLELRIKDLDSLNSSLEAEKRALASVLTEKREELKRSYDDYSELQSIVQNTRKEYSDGLKNNQRLEQQLVDVNFKLSLSTKECEQLKKNNEWLLEQFNDKNKSLMDLQSEKDKEIGGLRKELQDVKLEKDSIESKNGVLQNLIDELEARVKNLIASNSENEGHLISMKGQFQLEMNSMNKLCEMYDNDLKVAQKHIRGLETQLGETTSELDKLKDEYESKTQSLISESRFWKTKFDEVYDSNETLKLAADTKKPKDASHQGPCLNILPGKKTYTELYISYESEKERRIAAERKIIIYENRLNETLEHLKTKKEYIIDIEQEKNRVASRNDLLFKKLFQVAKDKKSIMEDLESIKKKNSSLETEQAIMKSDINDLIKQIRSLAVQLYRSYPANIISIENYVGDLVSRYSSDDTDDYSDIEKEIGEKFLETTGIEDIVRQSFLLRRFCKKIKVDFQKQRDDIVNEDISRANYELRKEKESLEEAKKEIEGLENKLRYALKQRNDLQEALKAHLKENKEPSDTQGLVADDVTSAASNSETLVYPEQHKGPHQRDPGDETFRKLYYDSMKQFDEYMKESGVSVRDISEKLEAARAENTEKSVTIAKLNSQVGFQNEKYSLLLSSFETLKQENLHLREKITSQSLSASTTEEKLQSLVNQLTSGQVRNGHLEAKVLQIQSEKQVWQDSVERISKEKRDLYEERNRLNEELIELRFKFNDIVNSQKNERRKYEDQILDMKNELNSLRKGIALEKEERYNVLELKTTELKVAQSKMAQLQVDYEKLKNDMNVAAQREAKLSAELNKKSAQVDELEKRLSLYGANDDDDDCKPDTPEEKVKKLERLLVDARKEVFEKQEDIEAFKQREIVLKELAQNSEKQLSEFNTTYDIYKENAQQTISKLESENKSLEDTVNSSAQDIKALNEKLREAENSWDVERVGHEKEISTLKSKIKILEESQQKSSKFFEKAENEMQVLKENLTHAQERYEKEVILHSSSLNTVHSLKASLEQIKTELAEKKKASACLEEKLILSERSIHEIKDRLENDIKDLQKRNDDLVEQNKILHSQFSSLEKTIRPTALQVDGTLEDDQNRSISELRELVSLVQRERNVCSAKLEVAKSENSRLVSEISHFRTLLDQERSRFAAELERNALRLRSENKHLEMMEKIEQNNILSESNATLRARLEESNNKIASLTETMQNAIQESQSQKSKIIDIQAEVDVLKKENALLLEELNSRKVGVEQVNQRQKHIEPQEHGSLRESLAKAERKCADLLKEKEDALESAKSANDRTRQLLLTVKRHKEMLLSKDVSVNQMAADLKSKSDEVESLQEQQKVLKDRLGESESKLQQTIQKANATMMQFKDKNRSLLEERRSLEVQISTLRERIDTQQKTREQTTIYSDQALASIKHIPVTSENLPVKSSEETGEHPTPSNLVTQPQLDLGPEKGQRHPIPSVSSTPPVVSKVDDNAIFNDDGIPSNSNNGEVSTEKPTSNYQQNAPQQHGSHQQNRQQKYDVQQQQGDTQTQKSQSGPSKPRHTKADLDSLRLKYNDLLSQIETTKIAGKLQSPHALQTMLNVNQGRSEPQLRASTNSLVNLSHSQYTKQANEYPTFSNDWHSNVASTEDSFGISKKFKSSPFRGDRPHFSPSTQSVFGTYNTHKQFAPHGTQPDMSNTGPNIQHTQQIEPGEINESGARYGKIDYPDNTTKNQKLSQGFQFTNNPPQEHSIPAPTQSAFPMNTAQAPLQIQDMASITQKPPSPYQFSPGANLKIISTSKTNTSLTPHQRAQLLKRKLEAAEAEIAAPSTSASSQTTLPQTTDTDRAPDTGDKVSNNS